MISDEEREEQIKLEIVLICIVENIVHWQNASTSTSMPPKLLVGVPPSKNRNTKIRVSPFHPHLCRHSKEMRSEEMGIKPCPVNGDECTRGLVPQECHSQSEKHKPSSSVREHVVYRKKIGISRYFSVL